MTAIANICLLETEASQLLKNPQVVRASCSLALPSEQDARTTKLKI